MDLKAQRQIGDVCEDHPEGKGTLYGCPKCEAEEKLVKMLEDAKIPKRYQGIDLDTIQPREEAHKPVLETCHRFVATFDERKKSGDGLIFAGPVGIGKTYIAGAIVRAVILAGHSARYIRAIDLFDSRRSAIRGGGDGDPVDELASVDLLVIDELGAGFGSDAEMLWLFEVIERRYADVRPTVAVSNLNESDLIERVGERIVDRLIGAGTMLALNGKSHRRKTA